MTSHDAANTLAGLCFLTALFRARWVALALAPPVLLILARMARLVDLSSASHPLRWIVPVASMGLAGLAAWYYATKQRSIPHLPEGDCAPWLAAFDAYNMAPRRLVASILVFASCGPDLLALHPFFWARFATWPLVPVQIVVCVTILVVLFVPERWLKWG